MKNSRIDRGGKKESLAEAIADLINAMTEDSEYYSSRAVKEAKEKIDKILTP
jgi:hypothetical protein